MTAFRYEDPPPPKRGPSARRTEEARRLRERPGEWAFIDKYKSRSSAASVARSIKTGSTSTWHPAGDFEAVSRSIDGEFRVYARYMGDGALPGD